MLGPLGYKIARRAPENILPLETWADQEAWGCWVHTSTELCDEDLPAAEYDTARPGLWLGEADSWEGSASLVGCICPPPSHALCQGTPQIQGKGHIRQRVLQSTGQTFRSSHWTPFIIRRTWRSWMDIHVPLGLIEKNRKGYCFMFPFLYLKLRLFIYSADHVVDRQHTPAS